MTREHVSKDPLEQLHLVEQGGVDHVHRMGAKPKGLWYGVDLSWLEWCYRETGWVKADHHMYELELDLSKMLVLDSVSGLLSFTEKYAIDMFPDSPSRAFPGRRNWMCGIDWPRIAEQYTGIEINPYQWNCRLHEETFWYYGWDVAGGCVWDPQAVLSFRRVDLPPDLTGFYEREEETA